MDQTSPGSEAVLRARAMLLLCFFTLVLLLVAATPSWLTARGVFDSTNLLNNPGFENELDVSWLPEPSGGTDFGIVLDPVPAQDGDHAASLNRTEGSPVSIVYIYQDVSVDDLATYSLSGFVYANNEFQNVGLELEFWGEPGTIHEGVLGAFNVYPSSLAMVGYTELTIQGALAPEFAVRARIKLWAEIGDTAPTNPVYFDDISFTMIAPPPEDTPTPTPTSTPEPITWPALYLNEILPAPRYKDWNGDGVKNLGDEWIEIYNATDYPVDLGLWILDDVANRGSNPYLIPAGTLIPAKGWIVFFRSQTGIALNDTGDKVRLLHPDGSIAERFKYLKRPRYDHSFSRRRDGSGVWVKTCVVTLGTANCP